MPSTAVEQEIAKGITGISVDLNRAAVGAELRAVKTLKALEGELVGLVAQHDPSAPLRTAYQQKRLEKLLSDTRESIKVAYREIRDGTNEDAAQIANNINKATINLINKAVKIPLVGTTSDIYEMRQLAKGTLINGAKSADWWSRQAGDLQFRFTNEIRDALDKGESIDQMVRRIRGTWDRNTKQFVGGIMNTTTRNAQSLIRTSVMNISNQANLDMYKENDDVLGGIEWSSTLDSHTSTICRALDGLTWTFDYKPIGHKHAFPGPTAHWGCRSAQLPIIKLPDDMPATTRKRIEDNPRAQNGFNPGKTKGKINYEQWLKTQPKTTQIEVLGPAKYELWRTGKLSMSQMVNFNGVPLTVEQLEKKYGKAA